MDDADRTRLRALCEDVALPLRAECTLSGHELVDANDEYIGDIETGHSDDDEWCDEVHADLIVGAVNALPALLDALDAAERERDEAVAMLRNLLARVHRDGGQHSDAVGLAQATREADEIIARDIAELARLCEACPSAIVMRPVDPMPLRGLPCACDEWGTGHLDGCPNGGAESVDGRDA